MQGMLFQADGLAKTKLLDPWLTGINITYDIFSTFAK